MRGMLLEKELCQVCHFEAQALWIRYRVFQSDPDPVYKRKNPDLKSLAPDSFFRLLVSGSFRSESIFFLEGQQRRARPGFVFFFKDPDLGTLNPDQQPCFSSMVSSEQGTITRNFWVKFYSNS